MYCLPQKVTAIISWEPQFMQKIEQIYSTIQQQINHWKDGLTAADLAESLHLDRSTASRYLNELTKSRKLIKSGGKPVRYWLPSQSNTAQAKIPAEDAPQSGRPSVIHFPDHAETQYIGTDASLKPMIEKGMAALFYPEQGLHILLSGETGVGKSYFAEYLAKIAAAQPWNKKPAPFITFNCADYAQNPELLMGHIFGIKKGAFTGATADEAGLVEQANHGILFLDEIHRLPPSGQEMLFYLIDKGLYRRLGETSSIRHAKLILIGATTENLESTLLPTLLRRFSLKLSIPPLRERTDAERKDFLTHFLKQEAKKMKVPLLIEDHCRRAFLKYACPGNIGQLKSDIQISCARAFMRHLQGGTAKVTIQSDDLPPHVLSSLPDNNMENEAPHLVPSSNQNEKIPIQNIYSILASMEGKESPSSRYTSSDQEMQLAVNHYLRELQSLSEKRLESEPGWVRFIDHDLLDALRDSEFYFRDDFPFEYGTKQLIAIGLHLEAYRQQSKKGSRSPLPAVPHAEPVYRTAAGKLADFLEKRIHLQLPNREKELLAHLMASTLPENKRDNGVLVYLITHGRSTASSMAEVTNYLLGSPVIHPVDMPLTEATGVTYKKVRQLITQQKGSSGILMLVDIGSLVTMGDALSRDLGIPIRTLANVNLPMLIEAGRKSLIPDNSLETVYNSARSAFIALAPKSQLPEHPGEKQRLIVTVCFTGEGTAQLLHDWLEEQLSAEDGDVAVRAIRVDPVSKDSTMLETFRNQYRIIAVVGTVQVTFDDVPFIPALELLTDDGHTRLHKLLEVSRPAGTSAVSLEPDPVDGDQELIKLAGTGLAKITRFLNPLVFSRTISSDFNRLKNLYQWDNEIGLGMWMHLGSLVDRMIQSGLTGSDPVDGLITEDDKDNEISVTQKDRDVWQPLLSQIESIFSVSFTRRLTDALIRLGKAQQ